MISKGMIDPKEALDILVSYSIAEEGTDTLYIRLVDTLLQRQEDYNLVEVEMILNYFPHYIWKHENVSLGRMKEGFYFPLGKIVKENLKNMDNRQFLSVFQGLTLSGEVVLKLDLLNAILNNFINRLTHPESKMNLNDIIAFMELYVQYAKSHQNVLENVDHGVLVNYVNTKAINPLIPEMSIYEISALFWLYHNLGSQWHLGTIDMIEERLSNLLRNELMLQKQLEKDLESDSKEGL